MKIIFGLDGQSAVNLLKAPSGFQGLGPQNVGIQHGSEVMI